MKNTSSLRLNNDFSRLYKRGTSLAGGYVVLYFMKNRIGTNRLGITASKKIGKAVIRNRARRLIKESYRLEETKILQGYDIVLVARGRIVGVDYAKVNTDMRYLFKKARLYVQA